MSLEKGGRGYKFLLYQGGEKYNLEMYNMEAKLDKYYNKDSLHNSLLLLSRLSHQRRGLDVS